MLESRDIQSKKTNTLASILSRNCLLSPIRGSRKAVWGTPTLQCQHTTRRLQGRGEVHHTCPVRCIGIGLYEGNDLVDLQAVPVVPFVLLVEVHSSILVGVVVSDDVHCSGLRCVVYRTAVAKRDRKVVYWPSDWFPQAGEMESAPGQSCFGNSDR